MYIVLFILGAFYNYMKKVNRHAAWLAFVIIM